MLLLFLLFLYGIRFFALQILKLCDYWCCPGRLSWSFIILMSGFIIMQLIEEESLSYYLHSGQLHTSETLREMVLTLDKERGYWTTFLGIMAVWCLLKANSLQRKPYCSLKNCIWRLSKIYKWPMGYWSKITISRDSPSDMFFILFWKKKIKFSKIYLEWMSSWVLLGLYHKLIIHINRCRCLAKSLNTISWCHPNMIAMCYKAKSLFSFL